MGLDVEVMVMKVVRALLMLLDAGVVVLVPVIVGMVVLVLSQPLEPVTTIWNCSQS